MNIEIENKIEFEIRDINLIDFDFSSIKKIVGNKTYLDFIFQITKNELIKNGQES